MLLELFILLISSIVCTCSNLPELNQQVFIIDMTETKPQHRQAALYNRYAPLEEFHHVVGSPESLERVQLPSAEGDIQADNLLCFVRKQNPKSDATPPKQASNGLLTHLNIDAASVLAIHILQVVPGDNVLDLSASQNANSIVLTQSIWPYLQPDSPTPPLIGAKKGTLHSIELGPVNGDHRLADTLAQYLPSSVINSGQLNVIRADHINDASELPLGLGGYDKILVGATEKPVDLLMTALGAVRIGGRVVYSARSKSADQNDNVVERAMTQIESKAKNGALSWTVEVEHLDTEVAQQLESDWAAKTAKGWAVSPDHAKGGWGPLYFSVLTKKEM